MTGAIAALIGKATGAAAGGTTTPTAVNWRDLYAAVLGATQIITLSGFTATISIAAAITGAGGLKAIKNGVITLYSGPFPVVAGDTLGWLVSNYSGSAQSGVVTVTNATTNTTMDTFAYVLTG
ncbi:MAG: hypothetical protein H0X27_07770 [Caulobacteraceae bacterium]|nr:hypothetical protein [Caulobacteraceae bacterium]